MKIIRFFMTYILPIIISVFLILLPIFTFVSLSSSSQFNDNIIYGFNLLFGKTSDFSGKYLSFTPILLLLFSLLIEILSSNKTFNSVIKSLACGVSFIYICTLPLTIYSFEFLNISNFFVTYGYWINLFLIVVYLIYCVIDMIYKTQKMEQ